MNVKTVTKSFAKSITKADVHNGQTPSSPLSTIVRLFRNPFYSGYYTEDYKEMVREIAGRLLSDELLQDYSYCGRRTKKKLQVYSNVIKLMNLLRY